MDCEKFDQHVIDALYDELDELTHAALKRHVEGCSRCAGIYSGLRATREAVALPMVEPGDDLEDRILEAVTVAQRKAPWPRKLLRGLAWAGSHAMRPQLAMAALFFLVIGSSLILLRAKPGTVGAPVRVTEHGEPSPDQVEVAAAATAAPTAMPMVAVAPSPAATTTTMPPAAAAAIAAPESTAEAAKVAAADGPDAKADDRADEAKGERDAAKAALADARAVRGSAGCAAAVSKFDEVGARFPGTAIAAEAMWDAAACYKSMGDGAKARELYLALRGVGGYRDRAEQALSEEAQIGNVAQNQMAARAAAPAAAPAPPAGTVPRNAAAAPMPKAAAKPTNGSAGKAVSAPAERRAVDQAAY